jgi:hypothetical protein
VKFYRTEICDTNGKTFQFLHILCSITLNYYMLLPLGSKDKMCVCVCVCIHNDKIYKHFKMKNFNSNFIANRMTFLAYYIWILWRLAQKGFHFLQMVKENEIKGKMLMKNSFLEIRKLSEIICMLLLYAI